MTTRFYSPVFNTALFDGPFRIYFSQSYESSALKIYHLLQSQHQDLWQRLKRWSLETKEHVFLLMYPEAKDVELVFESDRAQKKIEDLVQMEAWDEGVAIGMTQPQNDQEVQMQLEQIQKFLESWVLKQSLYETTL